MNVNAVGKELCCQYYFRPLVTAAFDMLNTWQRQQNILLLQILIPHPCYFPESSEILLATAPCWLWYLASFLLL